MKKSALIIGGGIAGLAAARELARNKIPIILIEAKKRLGGRIYTIHSGNFPIELGAEFVHGKSKPLIKTIREAKLPTQTVPEKNRIFENGKFQKIKLWEIVGDIFNRVNPRAPDCSFEEFLAKQTIGEREKNLTRNFVQGFDAANPRRISAHALRLAEFSAEQMSGSEQLRVVEGYSSLVEFLERQIEMHGGKLLKNTKARRICWKRGEVEVLAERNNRAEKFSANVAVIALPIGILKADEVKFEPSLPEKIEAAREMEFGNVVKIIFQFRDLFWKDFGFVHAFDELIPTWWSDSRGPILTGWAGGPKADALLKFSQTQLETLGLEILGRIFSEKTVGLRRQFVASHFWNWADDPEIRGAYSYIPVGGLDLPKQLAAPIAEMLFFAGEATVFDAQTGTVFGALESGLRTANEILKRK